MSITMEQIQADMRRASGSQPKYEGANVRFFYEYPEDKKKTEETGLYSVKEVLSVSIQWPGCDETVVRAEDSHKYEYPRQWAAFQAAQEPPLEGTPLAEWAKMPRAVTLELAHYGIKSMEQLAGLSDAGKQKIGPLQKWCKEAQVVLDSVNSDSAKVAALTLQLERQTKRANQLEEQIGALMRRIESVEGVRLDEEIVEPKANRKSKLRENLES